jgi:NADH-quinone oxidoreductase subunit A
MIENFSIVLLFLLVGIIFVFGTLLLSRIIQPKKVTPTKITNYECGETPIGGSWIQFNSRFYIVALIFIIFDVEVVFLYPWAVVFKKLGLFAFIEMMIFIFILIVGLAYVWGKGDLEWIKDVDYDILFEKDKEEMKPKHEILEQKTA